MANAKPVLYTGVTNDLIRRIDEHKRGVGSAFTRKYNTHRLVYFELKDSMMEAIVREKQIKDMDRKDKLQLILSFNPTMRDLYNEVLGEADPGQARMTGTKDKNG